MIPLLLLLSCAHKPAPVAAAPAPVAVAAPDPLDARPEIPPPSPYVAPVPTAAALSNGASLWVVPNGALPLVTVVVQVPGGSALDPKGKGGTAALSDRMLTQGAGSLDAAGFAKTVEQLGIDLSVDTDKAGSAITMSLQKDNLERGLDLLADMILRPKYTPADFARERDLAVSEVGQTLDELPAVAARVAMAEWFGPTHPYGRPSSGTEAGLKATTLADLKKFHTTAWNAAGASFTVSGDVQLDTLQPMLEKRLGAAWKATRSAASTPPAVAAPAATRWVLVDMPGSAQTMFYLVFPGAAPAAPDLAATRIGTIALGGTFTSRLNGLLREKRGYTYGARAAVVTWRGIGLLTIGTRIRGDATAPALTDLLGELKTIQEGVTAEELGKARGAFQQDQVEAMGTRAGTADAFATWQALGMPASSLQASLDAVLATDADAVKAAMSRYAVEGAVVVLAGDRASIEEPLTKAGFGPFTVRKAE